MRFWLILTMSVTFGLATAFAADPAPSAAASVAPPGLDMGAFDTSVAPCVDFFKHAVATWLKKNPIPEDRSRWGIWSGIDDKNVALCKQILEEAAGGGADRSPAAQKIGDFWATGMDTAAIEKADLAPLAGPLATIGSVSDAGSLMSAVAVLHKTGRYALFAFGSEQDAKDSEKVIATVVQGGLGLPDRDYYMRTDAKSKEMQQTYRAYVAQLLTHAGATAAEAKAQAGDVLTIETRLAKVSYDNVKRRDPPANYHPMSADDLGKRSPHLPWTTYFSAAGWPVNTPVNVQAPEFLDEIDKMMFAVKPQQWKAYLTFHLLDQLAPSLPARFEDAHFAFHGTAMQGKKVNLPRWKRMVTATSTALGEALGEVFVGRAFPARAKAKALDMVNRMKAVLREQLGKVPWMSPETRVKAQAKLDAFRVKIGYPDKFRDYGTLTIDRGPWAGNVMRASAFEFARDLAKIGKPLDREEWGMYPHQLNAYFNPSMNEIVFPAGILQPPLFHPDADDSMNLGGIGAIIGHEMGHGFDDQGAQFDNKGNLANWWSKEDLTNFQKRTDCVAKQFDTYVVCPGVNHTGKLVCGEAVGDLNGLQIAYYTLMATESGRSPAKDSNGFTAAQRLFLAFAQGWASHGREAYERMAAQSDPHPLPRFRVNGTVVNMPEFKAAFGCTDGQPMAKQSPCSMFW